MNLSNNNEIEDQLDYKIKRIQLLINDANISKPEEIEKLKDELEEVKNAIEIFKRTHSEYVGVWAFDNATSHTVMVPNALVAARINLYPGSKQPKIRNTI
ncbi:30557_t:CDS:2 [Gigaspora margarita]|uniref:30557_t:CDS:1 n=1 Tax=Gigaspora margarita TaxID=4874 RepID=A0ABN7UDZ0_GIGMA|nr:30557_t:CDS:2 [Gigaspora margarita]